MSLPGIGLVSYNGLIFDGPMVDSQVSIEPVRGDDDRAVIYNNITVQIKATVSIGQCGVLQEDLDGTGYLSAMDAVRHMLSQDGKALKFEDKIFRRFHVNTGEGEFYDLIDVNFGPRVKVGSIVPLMANKAFEVVWTVTAAVGQCPEFNGSDSPTGGFVRTWDMGDIKQFVYGVNWSGDHKGYTTRTTQGFIEIVLCPTLELNPNQLSITADDYRERLTVDIPDGFRRVGNEWALNEKKDRVAFAIRDEEIQSPNPFPKNVVDIEVTHKTTLAALAGVAASSEVSGFCEVANPYPATLAWERLYPIIDAKIRRARQLAGAVMFTEISVTEHVFSRRVEFSLNYNNVLDNAAANVNQGASFLTSAGMFLNKDVVGDTWAEWRTTMYGPPVNGFGAAVNDPALPFSRRSVATLSFEPSDDKIVTPCTQQPFDVRVHNRRLVPFPNDLASALANVCPSRDKSYIKYDSDLTLTVRQNAATISEMPVRYAAVGETRPLTEDEWTLAQDQDDSADEIRKVSGGTAGPMVEMLFTGKAVRMGYKVEIPEVKKLYESDITINGGSKIKATVKQVFGCDVHFQTWETKYMVAKSLADLAEELGGDDLAKLLFDTPSTRNGSLRGG